MALLAGTQDTQDCVQKAAPWGLLEVMTCSLLAEKPADERGMGVCGMSDIVINKGASQAPTAGENGFRPSPECPAKLNITADHKPSSKPQKELLPSDSLLKILRIKLQEF